MSRLKEISATGDVATGADMYRLFSVTVSAGADAASAVIRDTSGGNPLVTVKAPIQGTVTWRCGDPDGVIIGTTIHATVTGTSPAIAIEYT